MTGKELMETLEENKPAIRLAVLKARREERSVWWAGREEKQAVMKLSLSNGVREKGACRRPKEKRMSVR